MKILFHFACCLQPGLVSAGRSRRAGFTMLEILVVVSLLGIIAAIAAPHWLAFLNTRKLSTAQDQVFQAVRQGQRQAAQHRVQQQISFREVEEMVQWAQHDTDVAPTNWQSLQPGVRIDTRETTLARFGSGYRLLFDQRGGVDGQLGRLTLYIPNGGRTRRCVVISTLLGAARKAQEHTRPDSGGRYCY